MLAFGILLSTFVLSLVALLCFVWSLRKGFFDSDPAGALVIFSPGGIGHSEEPASTPQGLAALRHAAGVAGTEPDASVQERLSADRSSASAALVLISSAVFWLLLGSLAGIVSSIKLHQPDWLAGTAWLTFGRLRTIHLNTVAYGWTSLSELGIATWMIPRLLRTQLVGGRYAIIGAAIWNLGLAAGVVCIASGWNAGMEWLEIPWQAGSLFAIGGALIGIPLLLTLRNKNVDHLYVSVWYMGAALFWFPALYFVAKFPGVHTGVEQATMNWWYGHNVLGLFFTPLGLAAVYYFVPKVIGRPIKSYNLSLLGFWALAFFYGQVGAHHLIDGPIPAWLVTLSIVQSVMMLVPVIAFSLNQHLTMKGHFALVRHSPTLRFVLLGAMFYTLASVQGTMEALRTVNTVTHFTHFTVAHAHLGMYGFVAMVMFGAIYFALPRIIEAEWPFPRLISLHFWLVVSGFAVYFVFLTIGGWLQGLVLLDAHRPFIDSVTITLPYLKGRSIGGALMTLGHFVFAAHVVMLLLRSPRLAMFRRNLINPGVETA